MLEHEILGTPKEVFSFIEGTIPDKQALLWALVDKKEMEPWLNEPTMNKKD